MIRTTAIFLAILLATGCSNASPDSTNTPAPADEAPDLVPMIGYTSDMCFGTCPIIEASLFADGELLITGVRPDFGRSVEETPEKTWQKNIGPEAFNALYAFLDAQNVWTLRPAYSGDVCGNMVTDGPSWTFTVEAEQSTRVHYYTGCKDFPDEHRLKIIFDEIRRQMKVDEFIETELPTD